MDKTFNFFSKDEVIQTLQNISQITDNPDDYEDPSFSLPDILLERLSSKSDEEKAENVAFHCAGSKKSLTYLELEQQIKRIGVENKSLILSLFGNDHDDNEKMGLFHICQKLS